MGLKDYTDCTRDGRSRIQVFWCTRNCSTKDDVTSFVIAAPVLDDVCYLDKLSGISGFTVRYKSQGLTLCVSLGAAV